MSSDHWADTFCVTAEQCSLILFGYLIICFKNRAVSNVPLLNAGASIPVHISCSLERQFPEDKFLDMKLFLTGYCQGAPHWQIISGNFVDDKVTFQFYGGGELFYLISRFNHEGQNKSKVYKVYFTVSETIRWAD